MTMSTLGPLGNSNEKWRQHPMLKFQPKKIFKGFTWGAGLFVVVSVGELLFSGKSSHHAQNKSHNKHDKKDSDHH